KPSTARWRHQPSNRGLAPKRSKSQSERPESAEHANPPTRARTRPTPEFRRRLPRTKCPDCATAPESRAPQLEPTSPEPALGKSLRPAACGVTATPTRPPQQ